MPNVRCSVDSCSFWGTGNLCAANEVEVRHDQAAAKSPSMEIGQMAGNLRGGAPAAKTSSETCCQTFKPKQGV